MVSTRVDKKGNKVDDAYEKIRSQKVLQEILNQDPHMEVKGALENALTYNFSTKAQFKLLLEQQGFKITEKDGRLNLIKYGIVQSEIYEAIINEKIKHYQEPEDRIRQLNAIFHKYKTGLELNTFMETLNRKFGLKLILHQHAGHASPYGYTIIDYDKKQVLKGSQIMPLKRLRIPIDDLEKKQMLDGILNKIDYSKSTFNDVNKKLSTYGCEVGNEGTIRQTNDHKILGTIDSSNLQLLKYNGRVGIASQFNIEGESEKAVLAKLFHIKMKDLSINQKPSKAAISYYSSILQNLDQKYGANELLQSKKLEVLGFQNNFYLLDRENNHLFDIKKLVPEQALDFKHIEVRYLDQTTTQDIHNQPLASNPISQLAQLFDLSVNESDDLKNRKKKIGKQRQI
jgi:hypothetical protein